MDINRYRYIVALARTKNFTKAAEELHISQPALTKAIKKAEEEFGVTLFDREATPFRLTYAGERFVDEIKKILYTQDALEREMSDVATGRRGKVTVGIPVESASAWLPMILPEFMATHPDIEIVIAEGNSDSFERGMLERTIDFCIYTLPVHSPDLDYEIVEEHPIYLLSSPSHPFARHIDLATNSLTTPHYLEPQCLNGEKLLTLTPDRGMFRIAMQILERHGVKMDIVLQLTSHYTISSLAAAGLGLCFTTHTAGARMKQEAFLHPVFFTVDDPIFMRKTIVAYRRGNGPSGAALDLLELTKRLITRLPPKKIDILHS